MARFGKIDEDWQPPVYGKSVKLDLSKSDLISFGFGVVRDSFGLIVRHRPVITPAKYIPQGEEGQDHPSEVWGKGEDAEDCLRPDG